MDILIREAVLDDAQAIRKLNIESLGYDYPLDLTHEKLKSALSDPSIRVFVAELNDRIVGYVHAQDYDVLYSDHCKDVLGLAVDPHCQRLGVGRKLMMAVEIWAKETGADCVRLVSGAKRLNAHQFYQACGYECGKQQLNFKKYLNVEKNS